jgi:hypothetical protein
LLELPEEVWASFARICERVSSILPCCA